MILASVLLISGASATQVSEFLSEKFPLLTAHLIRHRGVNCSTASYDRVVAQTSTFLGKPDKSMESFLCWQDYFESLCDSPGQAVSEDMYGFATDAAEYDMSMMWWAENDWQSQGLYMSGVWTGHVMFGDGTSDSVYKPMKITSVIPPDIADMTYDEVCPLDAACPCVTMDFDRLLKRKKYVRAIDEDTYLSVVVFPSGRIGNFDLLERKISPPSND
jgi:hypothetical protein